MGDKYKYTAKIGKKRGYVRSKRRNMLYARSQRQIVPLQVPVSDPPPPDDKHISGMVGHMDEMAAPSISKTSGYSSSMCRNGCVCCKITDENDFEMLPVEEIKVEIEDDIKVETEFLHDPLDDNMQMQSHTEVPVGNTLPLAVNWPNSSHSIPAQDARGSKNIRDMFNVQKKKAPKYNYESDFEPTGVDSDEEDGGNLPGDDDEDYRAASTANVQAQIDLACRRAIHMDSINSKMQLIEIKWCDHSSVLLKYFCRLYEEGCYVDVGLECEGRQIKAHKIVISACSPYLEGILKCKPGRSPIIRLDGYSYNSLQAVIDFMYNGKVMVEQEHLASFLKLGRELQVRGILDISAQCEEAGWTTADKKKSNTQYSTTVQQPQKLAGEQQHPKPVQQTQQQQQTLVQNTNAGTGETKKNAFILDKGPTNAVEKPHIPQFRKKMLNNIGTKKDTRLSKVCPVCSKRLKNLPRHLRIRHNKSKYEIKEIMIPLRKRKPLSGAGKKCPYPSCKNSTPYMRLAGHLHDMHQKTFYKKKSRSSKNVKLVHNTFNQKKVPENPDNKEKERIFINNSINEITASPSSTDPRTVSSTDLRTVSSTDLTSDSMIDEMIEKSSKLHTIIAPSTDASSRVWPGSYDNILGSDVDKISCPTEHDANGDSTIEELPKWALKLLCGDGRGRMGFSPENRKLILSVFFQYIKKNELPVKSKVREELSLNPKLSSLKKLKGKSVADSIIGCLRGIKRRRQKFN